MAFRKQGNTCLVRSIARASLVTELAAARTVTSDCSPTVLLSANGSISTQQPEATRHPSPTNLLLSLRSDCGKAHCPHTVPFTVEGHGTFHPSGPNAQKLSSGLSDGVSLAERSTPFPGSSLPSAPVHVAIWIVQAFRGFGISPFAALTGCRTRHLLVDLDIRVATFGSRQKGRTQDKLKLEQFKHCREKYGTGTAMAGSDDAGQWPGRRLVSSRR